METYRNEQVRHPPLVFQPRLSVAFSASLNITHGTMRNHAREEQGIEPRERRAEASDQTPCDGEVEIAGIVDLAGIAVCHQTRVG